MAEKENFKQELENLEKFFGKKRDLTNQELAERVRQAKDLRNEINSLDDLDDSTKRKYINRLDKLDGKIKDVYGNLKSEASESETIFDRIFGEVQKGLENNTDGVGSFTEALYGLKNVYSDLGSNLDFWRAYDRRVREVGVSYGITGSRLEEFRSSNANLEKSIIGLGADADYLQESIKGLYNQTNQTNQITEDFVDTVGGMRLAMDISGAEAGRLVGQFKDLNISYSQTGKMLNDLRNMSLKAGLNTKEILKTFADQFEKLNTYSFKNGVQGMMDMVKTSTSLKVNMQSVLDLSDKFTDPEATMEFASNMQLLGGSFAQLGDFNKLMYDAAVAPEELAKNIAKATSSLGSFDRETGKFSLGFADRLQLNAASKQLGMSREEMNKMATQMAKINDIKMAINFKPLSEDAYQSLATLSEFDPSRGEYVVKFKNEKGEEVKKSIAELSEDDIKKISEIKETQSLKDLITQKLDAVDMTVTNLKIAKYESPDTFKAAGGLSDDLKKSLMDFENVFMGGLKDVKDNVFKPLENFTSKIISDELSKGLENGALAVSEIKNEVVELLKTVKDSDLYKTFSTELKAAIDEAIKKSSQGTSPSSTSAPATSNTPVKEVGRLGGVLYSERFAEGDILKGLSHEEGGIPFSIKGQKGFEAEGGEVLLTKGVSEDPALLTMASRINEIAGGKKLFQDGGKLDYKSPTEKPSMSVNDTNVYRINNENMNNIKNTQTSIFNTLSQQTQGDQIIFNTIKNLNNTLNETLGKNNFGSIENIDKSLNSFSKNEKLPSDEKYNNLPVDYGNISFDQKMEVGKVADTLGLDINNTIEQFKKIVEQINSVERNQFNIPIKKEKGEDSLRTNLDNYQNLSISDATIKNLNIADYIKGMETNKKDVQKYDLQSIGLNDRTKNFNTMENVLKTKMESNVGTNRMQGGLSEKRYESGIKSIPVNGTVNVGGTIKFETLKVTIDGTTKDVKIDDSVMNNIISEIGKNVNEKLKNTNVYVHNDISKRGTNVNDGKRPVMHGINEGVDGGVSSWFV